MAEANTDTEEQETAETPAAEAAAAADLALIDKAKASIAGRVLLQTAKDYDDASPEKRSSAWEKFEIAINPKNLVQRLMANPAVTALASGALFSVLSWALWAPAKGEVLTKNEQTIVDLREQLTDASTNISETIAAHGLKLTEVNDAHADEMADLEQEIIDLSNRAPEYSPVNPDATIFLKYDDQTGEQTVYMPGDFLLEKSSATLKGKKPIPFEDVLTAIGDAGKAEAWSNKFSIDTKKAWASAVTTQVDERLLQTPENLRLFVDRGIKTMKKDIDAQTAELEQGQVLQRLRYYFTLNTAGDKLTVYRDPGAPGGADVKPLTLEL